MIDLLLLWIQRAEDAYDLASIIDRRQRLLEA